MLNMPEEVHHAGTIEGSVRQRLYDLHDGLEQQESGMKIRMVAIMPGECFARRDRNFRHDCSGMKF